VALSSIGALFILKEMASTIGFMGVICIVIGILLLGLPFEFSSVVSFIKRFSKRSEAKFQPLSLENLEIEEEMVVSNTSDFAISEDEEPSNEQSTEPQMLDQIKDTPVELEEPKIVIEKLPEVNPPNTKIRAIVLSLLTGVIISSYSLTDASGVKYINPFVYITLIELGSSFLATPFIIIKNREATREAWKNYKKYIFFIGPSSVASYVAILFAFQNANAGYVVAMREVSVVIGSLLGFIFLKEKFTSKKAVAILSITAGLILVKLA